MSEERGVEREEEMEDGDGQAIINLRLNCDLLAAFYCVTRERQTPRRKPRNLILIPIWTQVLITDQSCAPFLCVSLGGGAKICGPNYADFNLLPDPKILK